MSLPSAQIEHQISGRMRLRVPMRRGDTAFFAAVEEQLRDAPGLHALRTNSRTGSLLLLYEDDVGAVLALARERGLFEVVPPEPGVRLASKGGTRSGRMRPAPHPLSMTAVGLAGLAVCQAVRGRILGNAAESLWHAYGSHVTRQPAWLSVGLAGLGVYQLARGQVLGSATSLAIYALSARRMARQDRGTPSDG